MENTEVQAIREKKRILKRYRINKACVERLEEKYKLLVSRLETAKGVNISAMPKGGSPLATEDMILDKMDLEKRIKRLKDKGRRLKDQIIDEIDTLDDLRHCEVLEAYFIDCKSIDDIADEMGYTNRYIYDLYKKAIHKLTFK